MESLRSKIEGALNKIEDHGRWLDFQRVAFHLASCFFPDLRATFPSSDLGADALIPGPDGQTKLVLATGVNGDLTKLKKDCKRIRDVRPEVEEIVFATTLSVPEDSKRKWRDQIRKEFQISLREVMEREWVIAELEKEHNRWLCKQYLEIPLSEFENLPDILPRIRRAALKLLDDHKSKHQFDGHFLIDLSLEGILPVKLDTTGQAEASGAVTELRLSTLSELLRPGDRCSITGVPGAGKTFSLLNVGSSLIASDTLIPISVSLRKVSLSRHHLLESILAEPSFQEQAITAAELSNAVSSGALLFLLNGWNEIARDDWLATTGAIESFIRQMPSSAVLIASRQPLSRDFKFPFKEFRIKSLSDNDIREAFWRANVQDAGRKADLVLGSGPLSQLAAVPLFLKAIVQEARAGNELPLGKQSMLRRMVERAAEEHRSALEYGEVRDHALRYLEDLAWEMTRTGKTTISKVDAHQTISRTIQTLRAEALLGDGPAPPDILKQLLAGHLLISVSENHVAFTHQLIQEHFAATKVVFVLKEQRDNLEPSFQSLTDYQWEQPLFLALEDLAEQHRCAEIRAFLSWFSLVDFEAACRMVGTISKTWSQVRDFFEPTIRHLASLDDVNARWLAARCAAATGQPSFHDITWAALEGKPPTNYDCYEGISSTLLVRALGEGFLERLHAVPDEDFRFRALATVGRTPSTESLSVSEGLLIRDPARPVCHLAFRQLFVSGRRGWIGRFFSYAKRHGWTAGTLLILYTHWRCTPERFKKFAACYVANLAAPQERIRALAFWEKVDAESAAVIARQEYHRLINGGPTSSSQESLWRLCCLKTGALNDHGWASPRVVREVLSGGISITDQLLDTLSETDRGIVVRQLLPGLAQAGPSAMLERRKTVELAPVVAAECLLDRIVKAEGELQRTLRQALLEVSREAIVQAALDSRFADVGSHEIPALLGAMSPSSPGGFAHAVRLLDTEILSAYRERLHHWQSLLPPMSQDSAAIWADYSTLLGEVGHPADADLIYSILQAEKTRGIEGVARRKQEFEAWQRSGRASASPGPIIRVSYGNWHITALANIPGQRCSEIMRKLLSDPEHIGVAAQWLATEAGADPIELSGSLFNHPRFDLIYKKRLEREPLQARVLEADVAIKTAIDEQLSRQNDHCRSGLLVAFCAVARLLSPGCELWILERLERHFSGAPVDSVLETITLAGGLLPGKRILPCVFNTVNSAKSTNNSDNTFLVTRVLGTLFFSDSSELAIELLNDELAWFIKSHQFRSLLKMLVWEESSLVDGWLQQLSTDETMALDMRYVVFECILERALKRADHARILDFASRLVQMPNHNNALPPRQLIAQLAAESDSFRRQLFARARDARSIQEASGWLKLISDMGTNDGVRVAIALAERFGEQLGAISSMAPHLQEGTRLGFQGWFYSIGGRS